MIRSLFLIILLTCLYSSTKAQQRDSIAILDNKIKFRSTNQVGVLKGEAKDLELQIQSVNGVQFTKLFLGIGLGLDYYKYRSMPLFVEVRRLLPFQRSSFFVYGDGGVNFSLEKENKTQWFKSNYKSGFYYEGGLGLNFAPHKKHTAFFSAGYSGKTIKHQQTYYTTNGSGEEIDGAKNTFSYHYRRIVFKLGWMF